MKRTSGVYMITLALMVGNKARNILNTASVFIHNVFSLSLGVMSARGILDNPAMYAGYDHTPISCVRDWVEIALRTGMTFTLFHHHLIFMLDRVLTKPEQRVFNTLSSVPAVLDYLEEHYSVCLLS